MTGFVGELVACGWLRAGLLFRARAWCKAWVSTLYLPLLCSTLICSATLDKSQHATEIFLCAAGPVGNNK